VQKHSAASCASITYHYLVYNNLFFLVSGFDPPDRATLRIHGTLCDGSPRAAYIHRNLCLLINSSEADMA
jgi:hypothetical protein